MYVKNITKLAGRHLLLKNSLTRNIQQVFETWKSLTMATMAMKTKGFMIRSRDEQNFVRQIPEEQNIPTFPQTPWELESLQLCDYYLLGP